MSKSVDMLSNNPVTKRLTPATIAEALFGLQPDRDERASQLCAETLLTLVQNNYAAPTSANLTSPKRDQFPIRTFITRINMLRKVKDDDAKFVKDTELYGEQLASGKDFAGSEGLSVLQEALSALIDPFTKRGQQGQWLCYPFSESLLWYDARSVLKSGTWDVRKVLMRGTGITVGRFLLSFPSDEIYRAKGISVVKRLQEALNADGQIERIARELALPLQRLQSKFDVQADEKAAWDLGAHEKLSDFGRRFVDHADILMRDESSAATAKLWSFRNLLAFEVAQHMLTVAWDLQQVKVQDRYLLMTIEGVDREKNPARQMSEKTLQRVIRHLNEALVTTLSTEIERLAGAKPKSVDWEAQFESRSRLEDIAKQLATARRADYPTIARSIFERADYSRSSQALRVLFESLSLIQSTGQYRYLSPSTDVLKFMVACTTAEGPVPANVFFERAFEKWHVVFSPEMAKRTSLLKEIDASELARNARRAERMLVESGLAISLSDSTTMVGTSKVRR